MRKIFRTAPLLTLLLLSFFAGAADAEDVYNLNQSGFTLPGVTLPQGQDEVHAADGTTCRSAASGSGAYLDLGVIQGNGNSRGSGDTATYGRVVIPLGRQPKRIDCTKLYQLEIERLQIELQLTKMGVGAENTGSVPDTTATADVAAPVAGKGKVVRGKKKPNWAADGWTIKGTQN